MSEIHGYRAQQIADASVHVTGQIVPLGEMKDGALFIGGVMGVNLYQTAPGAPAPLRNVVRVVDGETYTFHNDFPGQVVTPREAVKLFDVEVCDDCNRAVHVDDARVYRNRHDHVAEYVLCDRCFAAA